MAESEARKRSRAKFDAENTKQFKVKLNIRTDADLIEFLESLPNRQGYLKALVRNDMRSRDAREQDKYKL